MIEHKKIWTWKYKLLFHYDIVEKYENLLKKHDLTVYLIHINTMRPFFKVSFTGHITKEAQEEALKNEKVRAYFDELIEFIKQEKITHMQLPCALMPESVTKKIRDLWVVCVWVFCEDPENSKYETMPFVKRLDKSICVWWYFDENTLIVDKLKEWGAKDAKYIPNAPSYTSYDSEVIDYSKKDIDIIFVWSVNYIKIKRISKLKKHFKDRLKLYWKYGNGNWTSVIWIVYKFLNWWYEIGYIEVVPIEDIKKLYKRSKIWINIHLSYWPSNSRSVDLPLNGILQVADNPKWFAKLFEVWKEVVCYENEDIDDAIKKIEYYLDNEEERLEIAKAWYKRAHKDHRNENFLEHFFTYILN